MANATFTLGKLLGTVVTAADTATTALGVVSRTVNALGDGAEMLNLYSSRALSDMRSDMINSSAIETAEREMRGAQAECELEDRVRKFKARSPEHAADYERLIIKYRKLHSGAGIKRDTIELVAAE